ncbi:MAG: hypothetical protein ACI9QN_002173 [Arcticibacterium sp.]|jgi:hypothetical protein
MVFPLCLQHSLTQGIVQEEKTIENNYLKLK